jgi:phosphoglycerate dehydrogenase-like enzyme
MNAQSTAECTVMLLLMLAKRVDAARAAFAAGVLGEPVRCMPRTHLTLSPV